MLKRDEIELEYSTWNRAKGDERLFILMGRDMAAPSAIRAWVAERIRLGKNKEGDHQTEEALRCAALMEREREPSLIPNLQDVSIVLMPEPFRPSLAFYDSSHEVICTLRPDGTVEINPKYNVDEAAKEFWEAVQRITPKEEHRYTPNA